MILVVGPTGSGKTTTLHAALHHINTPDRKIWTAEDPVEITQYGLRQVQVQSKIGFDFAAAMRAFLRADPDVIMVGEMRDFETAKTGVEASLTGHLVFSTLHTNSAPETITRLLDMGIDPLNFADALLGILAQRLVRTLCKSCKEPYHPTQQEFDEVVDSYGEEDFKKLNIAYSDDFTLYRPKGCDICDKSGYKGRMGIHELLVASDNIKRMIQKHEPVEALREMSMSEGMTTLLQDGIQKSLQGITDFKQVRRVCIK
jgi:type II secretory ATPase GspE/PulE/Tfp pilus assembly ATPase PilB-like protein